MSFLAIIAKKLIKTPLYAQTRVAHKSSAGEVVTEFDLGADIQVRTFEPTSDIVPKLRLAEQYKRLTVKHFLSPNIQETGEP